MTPVCILVCAHKKCNLPDDEMYLPIQVGKAISNIDLGIQGDDAVNGKECDNISSLNLVFCEMTAMYWAWKNIATLRPEVTYVGLCHYRRYFGSYRITGEDIPVAKTKLHSIAKLLIGRPNPIHVCDPSRRISSIEFPEFKASTKVLQQSIQQYDLTTTRPVVIVNGTVRNLFESIGRDYIRLLEDIVRDEYPIYYESLEGILAGCHLNAANMIVLKRALLDEYCSFVFGVLFRHIELLKRRGVCTSPETEGCYMRVSGYLSELLTCTYITSHKEYSIQHTGKYYITGAE